MTAVAAQWLAGLLGVGGAGVLVSGRDDLRRRWTAWIVLSAALVVAFALPPYGPVALAATAAVACAVEYGRLAALRVPDVVVLGGAGAALPLVGWLAPGLTGRAAVLAAVVVAVPALLARNDRAAGRRAAVAVFGLAWLAPFAGFVLLGGAALTVAVAALAADVATRWVRGLLDGAARGWGGVVASAVAGIVVLAALGPLQPSLAVAVLAGPPLGAAVRRAAGVVVTRTGLLDRASPLLAAFALALALS